MWLNFTNLAWFVSICLVQSQLLISVSSAKPFLPEPSNRFFPYRFDLSDKQYRTWLRLFENPLQLESRNFGPTLYDAFVHLEGLDYMWYDERLLNQLLGPEFGNSRQEELEGMSQQNEATIVSSVVVVPDPTHSSRSKRRS